jgi:hypothetical protein
MERCLREIAAIEDQLRAGHPDLRGLCLALADWSAELRILKAEQETPPAEPGGACGQCQGREADTGRRCANGAANTGGSLCFSSRCRNEEKPPGLNPAAGRSDFSLVQLLME